MTTEKQQSVIKNQFEWTDELCWVGIGGGSNRHRPAVFFKRGDDIIRFEGQSIPGIVRVINNKFRKNGKWSYSEYTLRYAEGVEALSVAGGKIHRHDGNGGWNLIIGSWHDLCSWADVPEYFRKTFAVTNPGTSERLTENEKPV